MFKFVVLCALVAAATATPGFIAPISYSSNVLAPATTVLSSYPNNLIYSSPYLSSPSYAYSSPLGYPHLIKKRSAFLNNYIAPSTYVTHAAYASAPLATTYTAAAPFYPAYAAAAPLAYGNPIYSSGAYLIKK
ncbi:unnamed protein product [Euphydryas editha]|uniref:Uncharacterized protein n=1 Tax=Euphydryas editha TaxID=104508 RepID=A0AAU9TZC2_EUPED|nr:unnamed protein product [Euphydryas editha]